MAEPRHRPRRVLVTGGRGFIGSHLVDRLLADPQIERVLVLDLGTYAAAERHLDPARRAHSDRLREISGDIADAKLVADLVAEERIDSLVNAAAESHVDRSISEATPFLRSNVTGVAVLLDAARAAWAGRSDVRFHQCSTDEVFGSLAATDAPRAAGDAYAPGNPYSATKAAADHLVRAWAQTHGLPCTISIGSNVYGPRQHPEKLIPLAIARAVAGQPIPLYGDGEQVREWLHVLDHVAALDAILRHAPTGSTTCIGRGTAWSNRRLLARLCTILDRLRPRSDGLVSHHQLITPVSDRPGHDRRYALAPGAIPGWAPAWSLDRGLETTVAWYLEQGSGPVRPPR